jgi:uncharacterized protein YbjQ (UPF0145 family)
MLTHRERTAVDDRVDEFCKTIVGDGETAAMVLFVIDAKGADAIVNMRLDADEAYAVAVLLKGISDNILLSLGVGDDPKKRRYAS